MFEVAGVAVDVVNGFAPAASASLFSLPRVLNGLGARGGNDGIFLGPCGCGRGYRRGCCRGGSVAGLAAATAAGLTAVVVAGFVVAVGFAAAVATGLVVVAGLTGVAVAGFTAVAAAGLIGLLATDVDAGAVRTTVVAGARTTGAGVGAARTTGVGARTTGAGAARTTGAGADVVVVLFLVSAKAEGRQSQHRGQACEYHFSPEFHDASPKYVELNGRTNDRTGLFLRNSLKLPAPA